MKKRKRFFRRFWDSFWRPEMLILPGQIAFFLFLSLVPTITLIGYACSYLSVSYKLITTLLTNVLGSQYAEIMTPILTSTEITPAFFITLGFGYFIASNGMASIIVASNTIYGIKDSGYFKRRLKAITMELIIVVLFLFILAVPLLGNNIINLLIRYHIDSSAAETIINLLKILGGPISWLIIFLFIKLIYTMAPDKKMSSRNVTGGAIFTTIGWIFITEIYSYYISHYANYSLFYGSLANIVILMLWFYFLSYVFVIGMAMNYHEELERTGIIEVQKVIEASANNAEVLPDKKEETPKEKVEGKIKKLTERVIKNKDNKDKEQ